ncbi:Clathrin coat assembly protein AP180, partial [Phaethon lepturus]
KAPSSLMETLEQHLNSLEGKKPGNKSGAPSPLSKSSPATTVTSPSSTPAKTIDTSPPVDLFATSSTAAPVSSSKPSSDLLDLQPDFAATGQAAPAAPAGATSWGDLFESVPDVPAAPKPDATPSIDLFGTDAFSSPPHGASPVPESSLTADLLSVDAFAAPSPLPTASPAKVDSSGVIDLFGDAFGSSASEPPPTTPAASSSSASADLLAGFGGSFIAPSPSPSPVTPAQTSLLQPNFDAAFGTTAPTTGSSFDASVFDGLGDLLMPTMVPSGQSITPSATATVTASAASKGLGSDLDSSLANLVGNLGISGTTSKKGDLQWNAGEKKLTGGANWQPKVAPATWSTGGVPSGPLKGWAILYTVRAVPPASAVPATGGAPPVPQPGAAFGMPPAGTGVPMMPQQPVMYGQPMMRPPFGAATGPGVQVS